MNLQQKIGFVLFALFFVLLLGAAYVYIRQKGISASELQDRGSIVWQTSTSEDFNNDGKQEKVVLTSYKKGDSYSAYISGDNKLLSKREGELSGFEDDLAFCRIKDISLGGDSAICIFGEVGAHSENVQVIRWSDFSPFDFVDQSGAHHANISCDVPNFDFDYTSKQKLKIYFDNRDYDKNPLVDIIRTHYYLENNAFKFDQSERLSNEGMIK